MVKLSLLLEKRRARVLSLKVGDRAPSYNVPLAAIFAETLISTSRGMLSFHNTNHARNELIVLRSSVDDEVERGLPLVR